MPSDKRSRQRAGRAARVAELQRAQQRRNRRRRVIPAVIIAVAIAVALAIYTSTSSSSKKVTTATSPTSAPTATTTPTPSTTFLPGTGPGLLLHPAPAVSASCNTPAGGAPGSGAAPASGHAVSIVPAPAHVPFPNLNGSSPRYTKFSSAPPFCISVAKSYTATMVTDAGTVTVKLLPKDAPVTVNNFVFLAGYHFFEGITFHRVIPAFMDQVGDPTATGSSGPGYSFKDELPSSNAAYSSGAVAMANSGPNTNGSQFFIVVPGGGAGLTPSYSVFGYVVSGMAVIEKINNDGSQAGTPAKYHHIVKVTITAS